VASPITHAVVALSLGAAWRHARSDWKVLVWGVVCAEIPDADVLGFWFGVPYGDPWGHRGMTHSLLFAAVFAAVLVPITSNAEWERGLQIRRWLYFFPCHRISWTL
jgi:inner membrane protein